MKKNLMKYKKVLIPIILIIIISIIICVYFYRKNYFGNGYSCAVFQAFPGIVYADLADTKDNNIRKVTTKNFEKEYGRNIYFYNIKELIYGDEDAIDLLNNSTRLSYDTILRSYYLDYKNNIATYQKFLEYEKYTYEDYVVIICNTRAGNNNMYIGTLDLTFEDVCNVGEF